MSKESVAIVVDSTADINPELVKKYNIHVIPQILNWEGESLKDKIDITADAFYKRLAQTKATPTTSQPSAGEFYEFFSKVAETADSIVAVLLSDQLSGTLASARAAVDMMGDYPIELVDSRFISMGLGFMAIKAAQAAQSGASMAEVAAAAGALIPHMNLVFVADTLEYLHRGGRIGGAKRLVGSILSVKPVLHVDNGRVEPFASIRTKKKAVKHMLQNAVEQMKGKENVHVSIMHASSPKEADALYQQVHEKLNPSELMISEMSPIIGTHTGPGTIGMIYYAEP